MACYAGITADPERRKEEHKRDYPNMYNWEQHLFSTREEAQAWENKQTECYHHEGGREPNSSPTWYGYKFSY